MNSSNSNGNFSAFFGFLILCGAVAFGFFLGVERRFAIDIDDAVNQIEGRAANVCKGTTDVLKTREKNLTAIEVRMKTLEARVSELRYEKHQLEKSNVYLATQNALMQVENKSLLPMNEKIKDLKCEISKLKLTAIEQKQAMQENLRVLSWQRSRIDSNNQELDGIAKRLANYEKQVAKTVSLSVN